MAGLFQEVELDKRAPLIIRQLSHCCPHGAPRDGLGLGRRHGWPSARATASVRALRTKPDTGRPSRSAAILSLLMRAGAMRTASRFLSFGFAMLPHWGNGRPPQRTRV